jgi:transposase InsO family protein
MDFVVELPKEKSGFRNVLVVVDRFTKMAHFIPMTGINAEQTTNAFVKEIWHFHALSSSIVSDRGPQFVSAFWTAIIERLGIRRRLSTSFHP